MRKVFGIVAVLTTFAVVGLTATVAMAVDVKAVHLGTTCPAGTVWHFVHNKTEADSGLLDVTFTSPASSQMDVQNGPPFQSNNLHYYVTAGGTLASAADNVTDGKLVLSSSCEQPPPPPPPPGPPPPGPPPLP